MLVYKLFTFLKSFMMTMTMTMMRIMMTDDTESSKCHGFPYFFCPHVDFFVQFYVEFFAEIFL